MDRAARAVTLSVPGFPPSTYKVGRGVLNWDDIRIGDRVRAIVEEDLTVYVAPAIGKRSPDARVLVADPGYRLLTVQYLNGATETFKIGLHTRMEGIEAGDSVATRLAEVVGLRVRRHSNREESSCPGRSAKPVR